VFCLQLFTCGRNVGQLGYSSDKDEIIYTPTEVKIKLNESKIQSVAACSGATAILTNKGIVYLLAGSRCSRITSKEW